MELIETFTVFIVAAGIGVCGLCIVQIGGSRFSKQGKGFFRIFFGLILLYLLMHLTRETLQSVSANDASALLVSLKIVTFIEFFASGLVGYAMSILILYGVSPDAHRKTIFIVYTVVTAVHIAMLFVAQFTGLYFSFGVKELADGTFSPVCNRARNFWISNISHIIIMAQNIYVCIRFGKKADKRLLIAFFVYMISMFVAAIVQVIRQELQLLVIAAVGSTTYMFFVIQRLQNEAYEKQQSETSRLDTELSMATRIQANMLPNIFPPFPDKDEFDIFASMHPAKEVGGDFYNFLVINDDKLGIVIADVSGKGVPAALFMMASKILIRNFALIYKDPKVTLEAVNGQICSENSEEMFVTVWFGILDIKSGVITAANAGHEYPIIRKPDGKFEELHDSHGFVIGGMAGVKYRNYEIDLKPGSYIFLYTDGVAEAMDGEQKQFGKERLLNVLNESLDRSPREILGSVESAVTAFAGGAPQSDDLTMLCLKYIGQREDGKPASSKEMTVEATLENISAVTDFVNEQLEALDCFPKALMQIDVAIDELMSNIARYAYNPDTGPATVRVEVESEPLAVVISFIDHGKPYDPLLSADPDTSASAEERAIGGLGVFLVKKTMDDVSYEYKNGKNILKIKKKLGV